MATSAGERPGTFSQLYQCVHLVYFEHYREVRDAIAREKQLKGWRRARKNSLIATLNPQWEDLAADWFDSFSEPIYFVIMSDHSGVEGTSSSCERQRGKTTLEVPRQARDDKSMDDVR
jgi:hypothetical protein